MIEKAKVAADAGVWGAVAVGWLGLLQPWLTALATLLAIWWSIIQIKEWHKKNGKED